ncbi:MAG TPA: GNAT family N-acetyltransferase [Thermomicrobiales bacterium]|nr:GNAT family N-acetyltransferase [Thermomicrobiales bacterium]
MQPYAAEVLRSLGYEGTGETHYRLNAQALTGDLSTPILPDGVSVRSMRDDTGDFAARVEVHRSVWAPSKLTLEGYERLRTKPLYRGDLDLVVETAEGDLAAYCIVWWDPVTKAGEFEPVGTVDCFRGRGFGKAVLIEGLRRLRDLGAGYATVISGMGPESEPARRLYASAGFEPVFTFDQWKKPV